MNKKVVSLMLIFICIGVNGQQKPTVAVYTTDATKYNISSFVGDFVVNDIVKRGEYSAVERSYEFRSQLASEHAFQHSGEVNDAQIAALGKNSGAAYVCVVKVGVAMNSPYITARLVNTETSAIEATGRPISLNMQGGLTAVENASKDLVSSMFGSIAVAKNNTSSVERNLLRKSDLQKAGFRFNNGPKNIYEIQGICGAAEVYFSRHLEITPSWYYSGEVINGKLCGLVLLLTAEGFHYLSYFVNGEPSYPILEAYSSNDCDMLCIAEIDLSYGIRRLDEDGGGWNYFNDAQYRLLATELIKVYGSQIKTTDFLYDFIKGTLDIETLNTNIVSFVENGDCISPLAWEMDK